MPQKSDWKIKKFPRRFAELDYRRKFPSEDMAQICQELLPQQMEDKWFIYFEDGMLNFHRRWTGIHICKIFFEQAGDSWQVACALVNRNDKQYTGRDAERETALVDYLIDVLLLKRKPRSVPMKRRETLLRPEMKA